MLANRGWNAFLVRRVIFISGFCSITARTTCTEIATSPKAESLITKRFLIRWLFIMSVLHVSCYVARLRKANK